MVLVSGGYESKQHALNGNGAGGPRTTERKRQQKNEALNGSALSFDLNQLGPISMLLQKVFAVLSNGKYDLRGLMRRFESFANEHGKAEKKPAKKTGG